MTSEWAVLPCNATVFTSKGLSNHGPRPWFDSKPNLVELLSQHTAKTRSIASNESDEFLYTDPEDEEEEEEESEEPEEEWEDYFEGDGQQHSGGK